MYAVSPTGIAIRGVLAVLTGEAYLQDKTFEDDRSINYAGQTDLNWDDQKPMYEGNCRVFIDLNDDRWPEDSLILMPEKDWLYFEKNGEHPAFPKKDWLHEVAKGNTLLGYMPWLQHRLEED